MRAAVTIPNGKNAEVSKSAEERGEEIEREESEVGT